MEQNLNNLDLLCKEVARMLGVEEVSPDMGLAELGVNSLNVVEMILICELIYGDDIQPEKLNIDAFTTLRSLDSQLQEHLDT